jgi:arylsulfatase A-like enzyme
MKRTIRVTVVAICVVPVWLWAATAIAAEKPNILFCIADDASFPHMGAYGCRWVKTPGFDHVARNGILFTRAYTPNAKCSPSRACILTGRNTWQLKEACNHIPFFPPEFKTYAEALNDQGYFVGKTAKGWAPGVARDKNNKPRQLTGTPFDKRTAKPPAKGISNKDYAANFKDFLDARPDGQPWCFWYGCYEPHRRYEYGSGVAKGGKKLADVDKVPSFWPDNKIVRNDMLDYAYEIEHFDRHLVKMLELLKKRNELDNTMIVVTADNGMPFRRIKGQEYELSNHLPLAIMWKNGIKKPGRVVDDYVSFIDFAPTFVEVAKLKWNEIGMSPSPGKSLTDIFFSDKSGQVNPRRNHVLIGKERHDIGRPHDWGYPIRGIIMDDMLYLQNFETSRWPAGNPETGYLNCDGSPTKTCQSGHTRFLRTIHEGRETQGWLGECIRL